MNTELENMRTTVFEFIADLKDNVLTSPEDQGDLLLVEFFFKRMHPLALMEHVVKHVLPHKAMIQNRKVEFFVKQRDKIFAGLDAEKVDHFARLCSSTEEDGIGAQHRDTIWLYFDTMILVAESYKENLKKE